MVGALVVATLGFASAEEDGTYLSSVNETAADVRDTTVPALGMVSEFSFDWVAFAVVVVAAIVVGVDIGFGETEGWLVAVAGTFAVSAGAEVGDDEAETC